MILCDYFKFPTWRICNAELNANNSFNPTFLVGFQIYV